MELSKVRIGTSGYQFPDWSGTVYPKKLKKKDTLSYYAKALEFDTVELNYTYYTLPSAKTSLAMLDRVPEGFEFVLRSHKDMTHDIWEDEKERVFKENEAVFKKFYEGIGPFIENNALGCVLLQFPYMFFPTRQTYDYLSLCKERLPGIEIVVEFRNKAWLRESAFSFLRENGMGYCIVDEPRLSRLHPFYPIATSGIGYLRLHGRNPNWFHTSKDERYDYFYSEDELDELISQIKEVVSKTNKMYIFFNNCPKGQALRNAIMLKKVMGIIKELNPAQRFAMGWKD